MGVDGAPVSAPLRCSGGAAGRPFAAFDILMSVEPHITVRFMRTTLTIDPDVERLLRREMRRTGRSMKAVVNDALRTGLGIRGKPPRAPRFEVAPHAFGFKPDVDRDRLNRLFDEMEADERARKLTR